MNHKQASMMSMLILQAGGFITEGRVNGSLNLSRALGDMDYKQRQGMSPEEQMVTAFPEVRSMDLKEGDDFLLLACDGIWDVMTNQEVTSCPRQRPWSSFHAHACVADIVRCASYVSARRHQILPDYPVLGSGDTPETQ